MSLQASSSFLIRVVNEFASSPVSGSFWQLRALVYPGCFPPALPLHWYRFDLCPCISVFCNCFQLSRPLSWEVSLLDLRHQAAELAGVFFFKASQGSCWFSGKNKVVKEDRVNLLCNVGFDEGLKILSLLPFLKAETAPSGAAIRSTSNCTAI